MPEPVDAGIPGMRFTPTPSEGGQKYLEAIKAQYQEKSDAQSLTPELKTAHDHLRDICLKKFADNKDFIANHPYDENAEELILDTEDGKRVIVKRIKESHKPTEGYFLRDLDIEFPSEASGTYRDGQVDYNFQEDATVIKRSHYSKRGEDRLVRTASGAYMIEPGPLILSKTPDTTVQLSQEEAGKVGEAVAKATPVKMP